METFNSNLDNSIESTNRKDELILSLLDHFCRNYDNKDNSFELVSSKLINIGIIDQQNYNRLTKYPEIKDNYISILHNIINKLDDKILVENTIITTPINKFYNEFNKIDKLGEGGFGVVYKVLNNIDNNVYAIKKIMMDINENESYKILREVQSLSKLYHRNIVRYNSSWLNYDTVSDDYLSSFKGSMHLHLFVQMELCDMSLDTYITNRDQIDLNYNINIFNQIICGLEYIHSQSIIHRDIKPKNLFIKNNEIKIGDFGLSKDLCIFDNKDNPLSIIPKENMTNDIGTTPYVSPEQLSNIFYDYKTDIYSLGIILFELFNIFTTQMEKAITIKNMKDTIYPIDMSNKIITVCKNLTNNDPELRPSSNYLLSNKLL